MAIKTLQHGGVGMYTEQNIIFDQINLNINIECLIYKFTLLNMVVAVVYRPPTYPISLFKNNLTQLLERMKPLSNTTVIMGDFNENILNSCTISNFMSSKGFTQYVTTATTSKGTIIDHVYVKSTEYKVNCTVTQTYFSDHDGILCGFTHLKHHTK